MKNLSLQYGRIFFFFLLLAFIGNYYIFQETNTKIVANTINQNKNLLKIDSVKQSHTDLVGVIVLSPDGTKLASASKDRTIKIWDVDTESVIRTITIDSNYSIDTIYSDIYYTGSPTTQNPILFTNDGTKLLVALKKNPVNGGTLPSYELVQYDVNSGLEFQSFTISSPYLYNSPKINEIFVKKDLEEILTYDLQSGNQSNVLLNQSSIGRGANFILYTSDKSPFPDVLIYDDYDDFCSSTPQNPCQRGVVRIGENIMIDKAHEDKVYTAILSRNQSQLITVDRQDIKIWELTDCSKTTCRLVESLYAYLGPTSSVEKAMFSISPDEKQLLYSVYPGDTFYGKGPGEIRRYNLADGGIVENIKGFSGLFSKNGSKLIYFANNSVIFEKIANTNTDTLTTVAGNDFLVQTVVMVFLFIYTKKKRKKLK